MKSPWHWLYNKRIETIYPLNHKHAKENDHSADILPVVLLYWPFADSSNICSIEFSKHAQRLSKVPLRRSGKIISLPSCARDSPEPQNETAQNQLAVPTNQVPPSAFRLCQSGALVASSIKVEATSVTPRKITFLVLQAGFEPATWGK
ncbi:hypothetical protein T12_4837 [Trichinella patagoniensis]|uniref:Uncharacterized protein n=1 Tax=Trichinella patagoniensis TaxID=990121 RepID=A0A0V1A938_9BILA|nr:hypothetical protein T12_4837 [Trichinella patagoniensis]